MTTRIEDGRRRAAAAKRVLAILSAAAFLAALGLARATHPGHAASSAGVNLAPTTILPSASSGAEVQTHAS